MAAGDLALRILVTSSTDTALTGITSLGGALGGIFKGMANAVGNLAFGFQNLGTAGTIGMDAIKAGAGGLLLGLAQVALLLGVVGAVAAVGLGIAGVKAAAAFQQEMLKVYALTGMSKAEFDSMNQSLLAMAPAVGVGPVELAKALYYIESDGFKGAAALDLLRLSAIAAQVGITDTMTVAFALTSAIRAFSFADADATKVVNIMNNTVKQGKMEWRDYAVQVGRLSTAAKTTHTTMHAASVSFLEANAALATLTQSGSAASKSTTYLINTFNALYLKTDSLAKNAKKLHIEWDSAKWASLDLAGKIDYLTKVTHGNGSEVYALLGHNSVAARGYQLLADHAAKYREILKNLNDSQKQGNDLTAAWTIKQQGFTVQMSRVKAVVDVFLITIGNALLPVLTQIAAQVTPIIIAFAAWVVKSHVVENTIASLGVIFGTVKTVMTPVIGVFLAFIGILGQVITWVSKNKTAMEALKIILVIIGVILAVSLIVPLLALMVILAAVAIAIAIVTAVIMLIITVVKNWGNIGNWFMNIWRAIGAWLVSAWGAIGAFFVGLWNGIKTAAVNAWNGLVNGIRGIVSGAIAWLVGAWNNCVNAVVGFFQWLYNHNYYFKDLVDFIHNVISNVVNFLTNIWHTVSSFIVERWTYLTRTGQSKWAELTAIIQSKVQQAQAFITSVWNNIVSTLTGIWNTIKRGVTTAWQNISSIFSSAWGTYISGPLNSLWNNITNAFAGFAQAAFNFGKSLIQGLIDGINSMIGAAGQAAQNVVSSVKSFLGFHSPAEKGEGRYIIEWGSGMVDGFITGMKQAQPRLQANLDSMLGPARSGNAFGLSNSTFGGQSSMNVTIQLDGKVLAEALGVRIAKEVRIQGTVRNR